MWEEGLGKVLKVMRGERSATELIRHPEVDIAMHIVEGGLDDPRVVELLQIHLIRARAETALGSAHALDLSGLRAPEGRGPTSRLRGPCTRGTGSWSARLSGSIGRIRTACS